MKHRVIRADLPAVPTAQADENDLHVRNDRFLALGLEPITLGDGLLEEVTDIARKYAHPCVSLWRSSKSADAAAKTAVADGYPPAISVQQADNDVACARPSSSRPDWGHRKGREVPR